MTEFDKYFIPVYKRVRKMILRGEGCYLYADDGKYLDMFSGLGVNALGYGCSSVTEAIVRQLSKYSHISNYFESEPAGELAQYLAENTFAEKVFFTNSGTEAVEAGMKLIRKYGRSKGKDRIVTFSKAFHGRTLASASVTAPDASYGYNFPGGVPNVTTLEFNNTDELDRIGPDTAGVFVELVQGQGGVNVAAPEFAKRLRERTTEHGAVLMADEIQSGMGRTGKLFSFENYGIVPDIAVTAKAIGGGLPLGVLMAGKDHCDILGPGEHGSTFGGNPVACAAGLETVGIINQKSFLDDVRKKGVRLVDEVQKLRDEHPEVIGRISGLGLMIGIEILRNEDKVPELFQEENIFVNITQRNILRLLPPLIISEAEIDTFISAFSKVLKRI